MNREQVKHLALACGFKLKPQQDGTQDLNEYVYIFAERLLAAGAKTVQVGIPAAMCSLSDAIHLASLDVPCPDDIARAVGLLKSARNDLGALHEAKVVEVSNIIGDIDALLASAPQVSDTTPSKEHDPVNHPSHYTSHPSGVEAITITRHMTSNIGNAMKYLWRNGLKDGNPAVQDLKKAVFYIQDEIERLQGK